jgi:hypothetical protein
MKPTPIRGQQIVDSDGRLNLTGASLLEQIVDNVVITAPNGTNYRITVDNAGNLTTVAV